MCLTPIGACTGPGWVQVIEGGFFRAGRMRGGGFCPGHRVCFCFRQLKIDPERQSEIDPPYITQKAVEQINLTQLIVS
jgi:hypothetical protein